MQMHQNMIYEDASTILWAPTVLEYIRQVKWVKGKLLRAL
jgi:hypothetical protein